MLRTVWRWQRGNQNPYIEGQTTQWSTNHYTVFGKDKHLSSTNGIIGLLHIINQQTNLGAGTADLSRAAEFTSGARVAQSLVFCVVYRGPLFIFSSFIFFLAMVFSVLWITVSEYPLDKVSLGVFVFLVF